MHCRVREDILSRGHCEAARAELGAEAATSLDVYADVDVEGCRGLIVRRGLGGEAARDRQSSRDWRAGEAPVQCQCGECGVLSRGKGAPARPCLPNTGLTLALPPCAAPRCT